MGPFSDPSQTQSEIAAVTPAAGIRFTGFILIPSVETVNHHPARAGDFSTGEMRDFQPALTESHLHRQNYQ